MDEQLGPVAISIRKDVSQYRVVVRTSELLTLRGSVPEDALGIRPQGRPPMRELLELVAPEVQLGCLRLGTPAAEEALARLDEQGLSNRYKVGVLYCRSGQRTEEEMYNNQHAGPAFLEFLDTIGTSNSGCNFYKSLLHIYIYMFFLNTYLFAYHYQENIYIPLMKRYEHKLDKEEEKDTRIIKRVLQYMNE